MSGRDERPESVIRLEEGQRLRENYLRIQRELLEREEDIAAPKEQLHEVIMNALAATTETFDEYCRPSKFQYFKRWIKNVWKG